MEIKLPDYRKIASQVKRKKIFVEEKEVDTALKWLQRSRAKFTFKAQPAQIGDFVDIEYWIPESREPIKDAFILGEGHFVAGFEEKLIGMKANEIKEEPSLRVKMKSVQNMELPEITDEFAKSLRNFENLNELKKNLKEGIYLEKEQIESIKIRNEILEKINQETRYEIPEVLIEREGKQMLENFRKNVTENLKISFEDYLTKIRKTEKEILDSLLSEAKRRIKNFLVLREIGKKEKIEVSEKEVLKEAVQPAQKQLDPEKLKEYTKEVIRNEKIFQFLESLIL